MNNTTQTGQTDFAAAAAGWRRWHYAVEAEEAGKRLSTKLVELARLSPGDTVLDVAGGYGEPSLPAAHVVGPDGRVVCNDISGDMLEFGRERAAAAGLDNIEFIEGDAEQLDFGSERFDAVLSRSGLMFMLDVDGVLKRLYSSLKPDGRLAASVWGPPPTMQLVAAMPAIFEELEMPPPAPEGPGMFALADQDALAGLVEDAGFRDVETGTLDIIYEADTPKQFTEFAFSLAPAAITDLVNAQPADVQQRIWDRATEAYAQFQTPDGRVRTENQAIWVTGVK